MHATKLTKLKFRSALLPLVIAMQSAFAPALAADFTVGAAVTTTTGQTLTTNDTGTVAATGVLRTSGATQAITVTGTSGTVTLNNSGTIEQTGTARSMRNNTVGITFQINNAAGASILSIADDVFKGASKLLLDNQGTIWQKGTGTASGQALDLRDITATGNTIVNGSATNTQALIRADGDDALRPGANTAITNFGTIISNGTVNTKCPDYLLTACTGAASAHDAIDIGANLGVSVTNSGTISGPRHGITADNAITVVNQTSGVIIGRNGSGVGSDGTGTVTNFGTISGRYVGAGLAYQHQPGTPANSTANNGDGDGVDIDGIGTVTNHGRIEGTGGGGVDSGNRPNGGDGVALGGGTVDNKAGAVIVGASNGILVDDGASGAALAAGRGTASTGAGVGGAVTILNAGEITGTSKAAIGLVGNFDDSITNQATGIITGGVSTVRVDELASTTAAAAVQMGGGNDTLTNFGRIEGRNGKAIDMGSGNDTVKLFGGTVIGTVDGGTGTNTLETDGTQTFSAGTILNFQNFFVRGGTTTFSSALGTVGLVQIDAGATFKVEGNFATTGNLTVNGTLAATAGTTPRTVTVGGAYTQGASGVLEARVGAGGNDRVVVTGVATLANGATIRPIATGLVPNGSIYKLITAGTLTAAPASLVLANSGLMSYQLQVVNNELLLTAQNKLSGLAPAAASGASPAIEGMLTSGAPGTSLLLGALEALSNDGAGLSRAIAELTPENGGAGQAGAGLSQSGMFSAFGNRADAARSGGAVGATRSGLAAGTGSGSRIWMEGLAATGSQGARNGSNGYRSDAQGVGFGWERDIGVRDLAGVSFGLSAAGSDGRDNASGDNTRVKSAHLGGYFSRTDATYTLDASLVMSINANTSRRLVNVPGFAQINTANFNSNQIGGRVEVGLPFAMGSGWGGRWLAGARASQLNSAGYTESGSVTAQQISRQTSNSLQGVLGVELTRRLDQHASLTLRARYAREFSNAPAVTAAFVNGGPAFTVNAIQPGRDTAQLGAGYRHVTASGVSLVFGYDAEVRAKYVGHQLSVRGQWLF